MVAAAGNAGHRACRIQFHRQLNNYFALRDGARTKGADSGGYCRTAVECRPVHPTNAASTTISLSTLVFAILIWVHGAIVFLLAALRDRHDGRRMKE
jgi:hypothetical protein